MIPNGFADYSFFFRLSDKFESGDKIAIIFPEGFGVDNVRCGFGSYFEDVKGLMDIKCEKDIPNRVVKATNLNEISISEPLRLTIINVKNPINEGLTSHF